MTMFENDNPIMPRSDDGGGGGSSPLMATTFPSYAFYSSTNRLYSLGTNYVGECTWYCHGRAIETEDVNNLPTSNAEKWFSQAKNLGFETGSTPRSHSIACWSGRHVVFVESYTGGQITFSEANYYWGNQSHLISNGELETPADGGTDGMLKGPMTRSKFESRGPGSFQGYIYLD